MNSGSLWSNRLFYISGLEEFHKIKSWGVFLITRPSTVSITFASAVWSCIHFTCSCVHVSRSFSYDHKIASRIFIALRFAPRCILSAILCKSCASWSFADTLRKSIQLFWFWCNVSGNFSLIARPSSVSISLTAGWTCIDCTCSCVHVSSSFSYDHKIAFALNLTLCSAPWSILFAPRTNCGASGSLTDTLSFSIPFLWFWCYVSGNFSLIASPSSVSISLTTGWTCIDCTCSCVHVSSSFSY